VSSHYVPRTHPPTLRRHFFPRARHEMLYALRRKKEQSLSARCTEPARCPVSCKLSVVARFQQIAHTQTASLSKHTVSTLVHAHNATLSLTNHCCEPAGSGKPPCISCSPFICSSVGGCRRWRRPRSPRMCPSVGCARRSRRPRSLCTGTLNPPLPLSCACSPGHGRHTRIDQRASGACHERPPR
jgi:hypothetical protein